MRAIASRSGPGAYSSASGSSPRVRKTRRAPALVVVLVVEVVVVFFFLVHRQEVRGPGGDVEPLAVVEIDDCGRDRLLAAHQQLVEVGDGRLLVVLPVLGARDEHALADHVPPFCHAPILPRREKPENGDTLPAMPDKEHPASKAGRYVRAAGIVVGKEIDKRATAAAAKPPPPPKAPPPPPPPPAETTTFTGKAIFRFFLALARPARAHGLPCRALRARGGPADRPSLVLGDPPRPGPAPPHELASGERADRPAAAHADVGPSRSGEQARARDGPSREGGAHAVRDRVPRCRRVRVRRRVRRRLHSL